MFNCGTRMERALQRLAEANLTSKSKSPSSTQDSITQTTEDGVPRVNIAIVDTPPSTPSTQTNHLSTLFKGIPKALLEKVRIIFRIIANIFITVIYHVILYNYIKCYILTIYYCSAVES